MFKENDKGLDAALELAIQGKTEGMDITTIVKPKRSKSAI